MPSSTRMRAALFSLRRPFVTNYREAAHGIVACSALTALTPLTPLTLLTIRAVCCVPSVSLRNVEPPGKIPFLTVALVMAADSPT